MPHTIDLSKPLLEQKTVREMLGLSMTEETPKIGLDDLIKVAVHLVKTELADCNCDEDELISLELEYTLPHPTKPKLVESSFLQWKQRSPDQIPATQSDEIKADEAIEIAPPSAVSQKPSEEFLSRLAERMNEAVFAVRPGAFKSSTSWQFRIEAAQGVRPVHCGCERCNQGNGKFWCLVNTSDGSAAGCGGLCGSDVHRPID